MSTQSWFKAMLFLALLSFGNAALAGASTEKLPEDEQGFVDAISKLTKSEIVAKLGEPARAEDVKLKDSGRVVASIWHYHNINKDAAGEYYQTTELDIIDDKVSVVVFLNNDGTDDAEGQTYEIPSPGGI